MQSVLRGWGGAMPSLLSTALRWEKPKPRLSKGAAHSPEALCLKMGSREPLLCYSGDLHPTSLASWRYV